MEDNQAQEILKFKPRYQVVRQKALSLLEASSKCKSSEAHKSESKSINISDILADNTIVLDSPFKQNQNNESSSEKTMDNQENEILFKPNEITGRSTLYKQSDSLKNKTNVTVEDILASSFCDEIRRITLSGKENLCFSSLNSLKSTDFSIGSNENFKPAELMTSQLLRDELSWENNYLPIPNSEAITQTASKNTSYLCDSIENYSKTSTDFTNISEIENYFHKRSNQLESIINPSALSPPKRSPVKLVDSSEKKTSCNVSHTSNNNTLFTKTYVQSSQEKLKCESKRNYNLNVLTMSTIENVLQELNINDIKNRKGKSVNNYSSKAKISSEGSQNFEKENTFPSKGDDTVTFTESLLDDSNTNSLVVSDKISNAGDIRLAKSQPNFSQLFFNEEVTNMSEKRPQSVNRLLSAEFSPTTKSLSSTLLNGSKYKNRLEVDNQIKPPISPIRSKSITPKKRGVGSTCSNISPISSPRIPSSLSVSALKSPVSLNTTTVSERRYLCSDDNEKFVSPELQRSRKVAISPTTLLPESITPQLTAGSLASAKSRCNSQCSTSSEFTHRDGQSLPIKATIKQCCFGAIKLRTTAKKSIGIRNISFKRLSFKIGIEGPGFQIENMENNSIVVLQGQECRSFVIVFCPTMLGPALGNLNFSPPYDGWPIDKVVLLQGYGGHASIKVRDFEKGPVGPPYINMGEIQELTQPLTKTFTIYNRGPLSGFAIVNLNSSGLTISSLYERIDIEPKRAYMPPDSTVRFRITFRPRRNDIKKILSKICDVMTIANIRIITGDDCTRQRVRNIIKGHENGLPELTQSKLSNCWSTLPNEIVFNELNNFIESPEDALELASSFRSWEGVLTIAHCFMDNTKTSSIIFPDLDETILFRTMISASSSSNNKNFVIENDNNKFAESYSVRPNVLRFDSQTEFVKKVAFTITSFFKVEQYFEISSNYKNLFNIHPKEGQLLPRETAEVEVNLLHCSSTPPDNVNIIVYFEREKINIPVILRRE